MPRNFIHYTLFSLLLVLSPAAPVVAQIVIDGIVDETVYVDQVSFRVRSAAGFAYTAELDGAPIATDVFIAALPNYHEVHVTRQPLPSGTPQEMLVRFIVRSSERVNSEWGLYPWVPYPMIKSAAGEFAGSELSIIAPQRYPLGLEVPVVAWVENSATRARVGVNGRVKAAAFPAFSLQLLRGVGSAYLPAASAAGTVPYVAAVGPLSVPRQIEFEASTTWTNVSGSIAANTTWAEDSRISVTSTVTVAAGATLTIGAGTVIRLNRSADVVVNGQIVVNGSRERPVVFTPLAKSAPWGGFIIRAATSRVEMTGAILFGGCADQDWFDDNAPDDSTHLPHQPLLYVGGGAIVNLTDTYLMDSHGQAGHGEESTLNMTRCLYQRFLTGGEYNSCKMELLGCALIEFPSESEPFADDDGDAIYFIGGSSTVADYHVKDTLIGWAHDDGIDSGSGPGSKLLIEHCWIESDFHEGLAWSSDSGQRLPEIHDTVTMNCGQGIEAGWGTPVVVADHCLSIANQIGARFGDNYDWDYFGKLTVRNGTLLLFNSRDVWGREWDSWNDRSSEPAKMDVKGNYLTKADPRYPENSIWNPAVDAPLLDAFLSWPTGTVGIGIAVRSSQLEFAQLSSGVPVRLSTFTSVPVSVGYVVDSDAGQLGSGTLHFVAGETVKLISLDLPGIDAKNLVRVILSNPTNGELTDIREISVVRLTSVTLVPTGSRWRYYDLGQNPGAGWQTLGFADTSWQEGPAELGYGNTPITTVSFGPDADNKYWTTYFRRKFQVDDPDAFTALTIRLKRDDGAVVYLNNQEAFRSNMPEGAINYATPAGSNIISESTFFPKDVDPSTFLVSGENVVTVEVHQDDNDSSDLSFDLELIGKEIPGTGVIKFRRADANGDGAVDISDPLKILFFLFAASPTDCRDSLDTNDSGVVDIADPVYVLQYLFLSGPAPLAPFPATGVDPSADGLDCSRT